MQFIDKKIGETYPDTEHGTNENVAVALVELAKYKCQEEFFGNDFVNDCQE